MKKIIMALSLMIATATFAQEQPKMEKSYPNQEQRKQKQQEHLDKMQKDLNLSPEQVQKIKAMQDEHFSEMETKKKDHDAEMKNILTPDQYQKWKKQKEEMMEGKKGMHKMDGKKKKNKY